MSSFFKNILDSNSKMICVIAAPGSGKTSRILIPKTSELLANPEVESKEILLLTFSRLSALGLKNKVEAMKRVPRAATVHSLCLSFLLSEDNHEIRKRVESILLEFEKEDLLSNFKLVFPQKHKRQLKKELEQFSAGWATKPHDQLFEETEERRKFKAAIINWLSEHEAAMMEEIVYYAVDLAKKLRMSQFIDNPQYILVDEYQDLNQLEQEFIEILAVNSKLLLVVGDPDQSIYSFKFAHPEGIRGFAKRADVEQHRCSVTIRCPRRVVAVANQLLQQVEPGRTNFVKSLPNAAQGEVHFVQKKKQEEEFGYILSSVSGRIKTGASAQSIIVLTPRRKLGTDFTNYALSEKEHFGIPSETTFSFVLKPKFTDAEKSPSCSLVFW